MDIVAATESYERWMTSHTTVVPADLALKHQRMCESPFVFMRATFYRWMQSFPDACAELMDAPHLTAVGDLHVENFGTWRDREGRLVWGVNDLDEASTLPYVNDLVRLATSAALAIRERHLRIGFREACDAISDGYASSLRRGGEPIVLSDRHKSLRKVALSDARDPKEFWTRMQALPRTKRIDPGATAALERALPDRDLDYTVRLRVAGVGSLGRQRYVALAEYKGGWIAREAKAWLPSAAVTGERRPSKAAVALLREAVRSPDPVWGIRGSWIVRRLAPDCSRIEVDDLPKGRDERKLIRAMGWDTANVHLASANVCRMVLRDLRRRHRQWLERAALAMVESMIRDWNTWVRDGPASCVSHRRAAESRAPRRRPR